MQIDAPASNCSGAGVWSAGIWTSSPRPSACLFPSAGRRRSCGGWRGGIGAKGLGKSGRRGDMVATQSEDYRGIKCAADEFIQQLKGLDGGARRNRTADLLNAIQALSQLSYGPHRVAPRRGRLGQSPRERKWDAPVRCKHRHDRVIWGPARGEGPCRGVSSGAVAKQPRSVALQPGLGLVGVRRDGLHGTPEAR